MFAAENDTWVTRVFGKSLLQNEWPTTVADKGFAIGWCFLGTFVIITNMDTVSTSRRSAMMRSIKGKNTKPEMVVRRLLHADGYRFRVNYRGVIGTPDLVFSKRKKVILVHGCFWHRHPGCPRASMPKTNVPFWENKFRQNVEHDQAALLGLQDDGWTVLIVWECETKQQEALLEILRDFLGPTKIQ